MDEEDCAQYPHAITLPYYPPRLMTLPSCLNLLSELETKNSPLYCLWNELWNLCLWPQPWKPMPLTSDLDLLLTLDLWPILDRLTLWWLILALLPLAFRFKFAVGRSQTEPKCVSEVGQNDLSTPCLVQLTNANMWTNGGRIGGVHVYPLCSSQYTSIYTLCLLPPCVGLDLVTSDLLPLDLSFQTYASDLRLGNLLGKLGIISTALVGIYFLTSWNSVLWYLWWPNLALLHSLWLPPFLFAPSTMTHSVSFQWAYEDSIGHLSFLNLPSYL